MINKLWIDDDSSTVRVTVEIGDDWWWGVGGSGGMVTLVRFTDLLSSMQWPNM